MSESIAHEIAYGIRMRASGRTRVTNHLEGGWVVTWLYDCPCGETSGYNVIVQRSVSPCQRAQYIHYQVMMALEAMRRHVRSEGNEPSF